MNYNEKWDRLFNKFSSTFPSVAEKVVDGYFSGRYEIMLILSDGRQVIYDGISDRARFISSDKDYLEESTWSTEFAFRLRKRMERAGIGQKELASAIGVTQGSVSNYLSGRSIPNAHVLMRISKTLDCSITELCDF